jgi:hypothetical protein
LANSPVTSCAILDRLELAIQTLQSLTSHDGGLLPGGMLVRQILTLVINLGFARGRGERSISALG